MLESRLMQVSRDEEVLRRATPPPNDREDAEAEEHRQWEAEAEVIRKFEEQQHRELLASNDAASVAAAARIVDIVEKLAGPGSGVDVLPTEIQERASRMVVPSDGGEARVIPPRSLGGRASALPSSPRTPIPAPPGSAPGSSRPRREGQTHLTASRKHRVVKADEPARVVTSPASQARPTSQQQREKPTHFALPTLSSTCRTPTRGAGLRLSNIDAGAPSNAPTPTTGGGRTPTAAFQPGATADDEAPAVPQWEAFKAQRRDIAGFASLSRWAQMVFEDAVTACRNAETRALPPKTSASGHYRPPTASSSSDTDPDDMPRYDSDGELIVDDEIDTDDLVKKDEVPNKLLTSVSCMILDHVMGSTPGYEQLWPRLRTQIFGAVFSNRCGVASERSPALETDDPRMEAHQHEANAANVSQYRQEFGKATTYYDKCIELSESLLQARQTIAESRGMADKFAIISDMTNTHQNRKTQTLYFNAWRLTVMRERKKRDAITAYAKRSEDNGSVRIKFQKWRRLTVLMRWRRTNAKLDEAQEQSKQSIADLKIALDEMTDRYSEDTKALRFELEQEQEIRRNMMESHGVELNEKDTVSTAKDSAIFALQKECRRWQRVAKTLRPVEDQYEPFPEVVHEALQLRALEKALLLGERNAHVKARTQLEKLLVTWVNCELEGAGIRMEPILNCTSSLRDGEVLMNLVKILRPPNDAMGRNRGELDVFTSVASLMHVNTHDGLFPPLLLQCPFYKKFFTPKRFLQAPHPTAGLWIIASLFVARALRTPLPNFDSAPSLSSIGGFTAGVPGPMKEETIVKIPAEMLTMQGVNFGEKSAASEAVVDQLQRGGKAAAATLNAPSMSPMIPVLSPASRNRPRRVSLDSPSPSRRGSDALRTGLVSVRSPTGSRRGSLLTGASPGPRNETIYEDNDSDNEAFFGELPTSSDGFLPQLPAELQQMDLKQFVKFVTTNSQNRLQWNGLARIVTAIVCRHRVLDLESAAARRANATAAAKVAIAFGEPQAGGRLGSPDSSRRPSENPRVSKPAKSSRSLKRTASRRQPGPSEASVRTNLGDDAGDSELTTPLVLPMLQSQRPSHIGGDDDADGASVSSSRKKKASVHFSVNA